MKGLRRRGLKDSRHLANNLDCWVAGPCEGSSNWWETQARNAAENLWIAARVHLKASQTKPPQASPLGS